MAEKDLWKNYRDHMRKYGHLQRIENMVGVGVCDISQCLRIPGSTRGVESWVELKQLPSWPRDPEAIVKVDHYTPQQRNWQRARGQAGGRVYVFIQIDKDFLLFSWTVAVATLGLSPRAVLEAGALLRATSFPERELMREFTALTPYKSTT